MFTATQRAYFGPVKKQEAADSMALRLMMVPPHANVKVVPAPELVSRAAANGNALTLVSCPPAILSCPGMEFVHVLVVLVL